MPLRAGMPGYIAAKRRRHKDASVTLDVSADALPDDDSSAMDVLARAVFGT